LGIDRWRGPDIVEPQLRDGSSLFVVPELLLAVALMFVFTQLINRHSPRHNAEVAALVCGT